nr:pentatricopeptide repeat-containing protein At1g69290 [Ipomoea trifida]
MAFDNLLLRYSVAMASVRDGDVVCRVLYEEAENSEGYYRRLEKCHLKVLGLGVRKKSHVKGKKIKHSTQRPLPSRSPFRSADPPSAAAPKPNDATQKSHLNSLDNSFIAHLSSFSVTLNLKRAFASVVFLIEKNP